MGTNTLNNRSAGQTILDTFFNDIHQAMNSDFVGRNSSGVPTEGQNLGTTALPWGVLNVDSIVVDGETIDPSLSTTPQNIVISGKTRSTSRQAAYITPNGSALSLIVAGSATNLVLNINSSAVTVATDITKSSLTAAASSNNTCLLDETQAAGQDDTRKWGGVAHRKDSLTVDNMGSSITALVGTWAAFKTGTEYFLAFVESTTKLSKVRRGYFYNSSLNPLNPVVLTNNDVITVMKLGHIFIEDDATTVDVSYTMPVYDYVAPSSPVTGDYWYDLGNSVWKRYDGASFEIINRTYAGMFVSDTTACVAARAEEFYANYKENLDIDFELVSSTVVRSNFLHASASVFGKEIQFSNTAPSWDITAHLASSVDMFNATEQASTMYYLYLSDLGEKKISDIEPLYFGNKKAWYHPHNTWRCVGLAYNDGSSNIAYVSAKGSKRTFVKAQANTGGHGSTNTKIRRLDSHTEQYGASVIWADSATLGTTFTVFEAGYYSINSTDRFDGGNAELGISKSSTQLTTNISSITSADRVAYTSTTTTKYDGLAGTVFCKVGDVIRHHTDGNPNLNNPLVSMRVAKVSGFLDASS